MTLPTIFATLPSGNVPASDLDTNFSILEGAIVQPVVATGVVNAYVLAPVDPWITGYANYAGNSLNVIFNISNTGSVSVNVSGLGAVAVNKNVSGVATALTTGDIFAGVPYTIICDGSVFWLQSLNVGVATTASAGVVQLATAAVTHAATSTSQVAPVGTMGSHPGVAKAWVNFTPPNTINASYNVASVVHNATGKYTVNFTNAMADANYCLSGFCVYTSGSIVAGLLGGSVADFSASTGSCNFQTSDTATGNPQDMTTVMLIVHGN